MLPGVPGHTVAVADNARGHPGHPPQIDQMSRDQLRDEIAQEKFGKKVSPREARVPRRQVRVFGWGGGGRGVLGSSGPWPRCQDLLSGPLLEPAPLLLPHIQPPARFSALPHAQFMCSQFEELAPDERMSVVGPRAAAGALRLSRVFAGPHVGQSYVRSDTSAAFVCRVLVAYTGAMLR